MYLLRLLLEQGNFDLKINNFLSKGLFQKSEKRRTFL